MKDSKKPNQTQLSRRGFLRGQFFKADASSQETTEKKVQTSTIRTSDIPLLRPPHALDEAHFLSECDACGACINACPHQALRASTAAQTPHFVMEEVPCHLCEDMPCVNACPTNALGLQQELHIGRAFLKVMNCLASLETFCTVCLERCPIEGAIILERGKPKIMANQCVGCGQCVYRCPAPSPALIVLPQ